MDLKSRQNCLYPKKDEVHLLTQTAYSHTKKEDVKHVN